MDDIGSKPAELLGWDKLYCGYHVRHVNLGIDVILKVLDVASMVAEGKT